MHEITSCPPFLGSIPYGRNQFGNSSTPILLDNINCYGNELNLLLCSHNGVFVHDCDATETAGVVCEGSKNLFCSYILYTTNLPGVCAEGSVRLLTSTDTLDYTSDSELDDLLMGRVEVCTGRRYRTVCDESWDNKDASVVCKQLGFSPYGMLTNYSSNVHTHFTVIILNL